MIFRAIMGQGLSPILGHVASATVGHSFSARLGGDGAGERGDSSTPLRSARNDGGEVSGDDGMGVGMRPGIRVVMV